MGNGRNKDGMWEADSAQGIECGKGDRCGGLKAEFGRVAERGMEVAGPAKGETIANGHGGNSAGHRSADPMLIGGLVAEYLVLKST